MTIYSAKITEIGIEAFTEETLIVLFKDDVMEDLRPYCVLHRGGEVSGELNVGQTLILGDHSYTIKSIGSVATKNLKDLGHISVCFTNLESVNNPGDISVYPMIRPNLSVGESIIIKDNGEHNAN